MGTNHNSSRQTKPLGRFKALKGFTCQNCQWHHKFGKYPININNKYLKKKVSFKLIFRLELYLGNTRRDGNSQRCTGDVRRKPVHETNMRHRASTLCQKEPKDHAASVGSPLTLAQLVLE